MRRAPVLAAESLTLLALCLAPWPFGSAGDSARVLAGTLLLAGASWMAACILDGRAVPASFSLLGIPLLCVLQMALGASAAAVWTAEALLVSAAMLATLTLVQALADARGALRLASAVLLAGFAQAAFGAYSWSMAPTHIYGVARADVAMPFGSLRQSQSLRGLRRDAGAPGSRDGDWSLPLRAQADGAFAGAGGSVSRPATVHAASRSRGGLVALAVGRLRIP